MRVPGFVRTLYSNLVRPVRAVHVSTRYYEEDTDDIYTLVHMSRPTEMYDLGQADHGLSEVSNINTGVQKIITRWVQEHSYY